MPNDKSPRTSQRLTKRVVDALPPQTTIWDSELVGFGVRRQRRDAVFVLKYVFEQRQRFFTIGRHGALTVDQARAKAKQLAGQIASGTDPAALAAPTTAPVTVEGLCRVYLAEGPSHKPDKRQSSWKTDACNIERQIIPLIGHRAAGGLTEKDIARFIADVVAGETRQDVRTGTRKRSIVRGGKGVAARSLAVLGAAYAFGLRQGLVSTNPVVGIKAPKGRSPGRFLTIEEWGRLGSAMAERRGRGSAAFIDAIQLLALTGCRRSEITGLKWSEIDRERGLLRLDASKTGARVVPLGDGALELIDRLKDAAADEWVFPSSKGTGPIVGVQKVWNEIRIAAGLPTVRIHDLRHSFASQAVNSGASLYMTGAILGHRQSSTTQRYAHLQADPVRQVATGAASRISEAMRGK